MGRQHGVVHQRNPIGVEIWQTRGDRLVLWIENSESDPEVLHRRDLGYGTVGP